MSRNHGISIYETLSAQELKDRLDWANNPDPIEAIMALCNTVRKLEAEVETLRAQLGQVVQQ